MARPKNKFCCFCGNPATTSDHIPSAGIFPSPRPQDLITVPACKECNEKTSLDEEYFIAAIVTAGSYSCSAEKLINQKIIPKARQKPALLYSIIKNSQKVDVYSEGGIYMGEQTEIKYDRQRFQNVIEKYVRGLFWHEKKEPLGDDYIVKPFIRNPPLFDDGIKAGIVSLPIKKLGDGQVFSYRYLTDFNDPKISCWFLRFFNSSLFVALTEEPQDNRGHSE
jgi:hypothetical protein